MVSSRIEQKIEDIYAFVESCKPQALSQSKVVVPKNDLYDLLDDLRRDVPEEITRYQKMLSQRDAILEDAEAKADAIKLDAQEQYKAMVEEHAIMQEAYQQAEETVARANAEAQAIIDTARRQAEEIGNGAIYYTTDMLEMAEKAIARACESAVSNSRALETALRGHLDIIRHNKAELTGVNAMEEEEPQEAPEERDEEPYTLSGYESSDYLQRIAMHINGKIAEFRAQEGYARLETELKNVLLAINLSDDYQKAQNTIRELKQDNEDMEKELFDMKHEMISMQRELQEAKDAVKKLEQEKESEEHRAIRLETELEQLRKEIAKEVVQKEETVDVAADTKPSAELTATQQTAPENADKEETVEKQDVAEDVTHSEDTEAAVTVEQTDNVAEEAKSPEEIGQEIAATIGKKEPARKTSRSSRKKRR